MLIRLEHPVCPFSNIAFPNALSRPRRPARTLRHRLEIQFSLSPRIFLAPDIGVEARVLAVIGVETAFGDVFAMGLARFTRVRNDRGNIAGGRVYFG